MKERANDLRLDEMRPMFLFLEQILWGLRNTITDDAQLLTTANSVFDALLTAFTEKA